MSRAAKKQKTTELPGRDRSTEAPEKDTLSPTELPEGCAVCSRFPDFVTSVGVSLGDTAVFWVISAPIRNSNKTQWFPKLDFGSILTLVCHRLPSPWPIQYGELMILENLEAKGSRRKKSLVFSIPLSLSKEAWHKRREGLHRLSLARTQSTYIMSMMVSESMDNQVMSPSDEM